MADDDDKENERDREEYIEIRKGLDEVAQNASNSFDKAVLTLSGGALFLSLTYIKEIARRPHPDSLWFIMLGWLAFVISISAILISFSCAKRCVDCRIYDHDKRYRPDLDFRKPKGPWGWVAGRLDNDDPWGHLVDLMNFTAIVAFIIGVALVLSFCLFNLNRAVTDARNEAQLVPAASAPTLAR